MYFIYTPLQIKYYGGIKESPSLFVRLAIFCYHNSSQMDEPVIDKTFHSCSIRPEDIHKVGQKNQGK